MFSDIIILNEDWLPSDNCQKTGYDFLRKLNFALFIVDL